MALCVYCLHPLACGLTHTHTPAFLTPAQYVADVDNLCLMMNLLKDPSRSIQFEAFHVFKVRRAVLCSAVPCCAVEPRACRRPGPAHPHTACPAPSHSPSLPSPPSNLPAPAALQVFVANPNKTRAVVEILHNNRDKLLKYLADFHNDRGEGREEGGCWAAALCCLLCWAGCVVRALGRGAALGTCHACLCTRPHARTPTLHLPLLPTPTHRR